MPPRLILFDCDGTLIDSQDMIIGAMNKAFDDAELAAPTPQQTRSIIGLSLELAVSTLVEACDHDVGPAKLAELTEGYKTAFFDLRLKQTYTEPMFDGAREILEGLNRIEHNILGVATGKSRRGLDAVLDREALQHYFVTLQTADDAPSKPDPGMIINAMQATGIDPGQTVMIGDSKYDIEMAVNAGVQAVGVAWGYHEVDWLKEAGAHFVAHDFGELTRYLDEVA